MPTRHNYGLGLPQYRIERTLAGWASELGTKTHLGCEVTGFTQDDSGVDVKLSDGATLRTQYLVGPELLESSADMGPAIWVIDGRRLKKLIRH